MLPFQDQIADDGKVPFKGGLFGRDEMEGDFVLFARKAEHFDDARLAPVKGKHDGALPGFKAELGRIGIRNIGAEIVRIVPNLRFQKGDLSAGKLAL